MSMLDRRTVVAGIAGALPAAAIGGASALGSPDHLAQLIEQHRVAWRAFSDAYDAGSVETNPAVFAASDAESAALLALCSYRCQSIEEAGVKAAYLLNTIDVRDDELQPDCVAALLQSFAPLAA